MNRLSPNFSLNPTSYYLVTRLENVALICIPRVPCAAEMFVDLPLAPPSQPELLSAVLVGCVFSECVGVEAMMLL
jgi:hypothetical protein